MATGSGPSHLVKDRGAVVASEEHITGNSKTEGKTMEAAATSSIKCRDPGILVKPFFVLSSSSSWICPSSSTRLLASWIWRCGADGRQSDPLKKRGIDRDDGDRATTNGVGERTNETREARGCFDPSASPASTHPTLAPARV
uniref:Uncharacterized protein n=1 Tax=Oryza nivara TaxID=4536 RepID=A0A0E0GUR9_ORYNI